MLLNEIMPEYDFNEVHTISVNATRNRAYRAIKEVTAAEIWLFKALMTLRMLPGRIGRKRKPEGADWKKPLLDEAQKAGFVLLAEEEGKEVVLGTVGQFWKLSGGIVQGLRSANQFMAFDGEGYAKAAISFHVAQGPKGGMLIRTETRIRALDLASRRRFSRYWRAVHPGSALIRAMWLRAIRRRAER